MRTLFIFTNLKLWINMERVLHLFITNRCRHKCELCCNKLYKISEIPVVTVELLKSVDTVCLTGGEPFGIDSFNLRDFIIATRKQYPNIQNMYIYTSGKEFGAFNPSMLEYFITDGLVNGYNIAPKDFEDWTGFASMVRCSDVFIGHKWKGREDEYNAMSSKLSHRLYVFKEQKPIFDALKLNLEGLHINVIDRQWTQVFNTSDNEHFARLPILFD